MGTLRNDIAGIVFVVGVLILVSAGTINTIWTLIPDEPLNGVERSAPRPTLAFGAVTKETFQSEFTAWFEQHWGLRGYAAKTDNSINADVFHETRPGSSVVLCDDDVLINGEDVAFINRIDPPDAQIQAADLIARVQQKLLRQGSVMIPVVIPAKTHFYSEQVPARWRRSGAFGMALDNIYGAFVQRLREDGVRFVDGPAVLSAHPPFEVFPPTGRHWRMSSGCETLNLALDLARPDLPELADQRVDCHFHVDPNPSIEHEDYDLFRLENVWGKKPAGIQVQVLDGKKGGLAIPTLFVGSSFVWKFARIANELDVLRPSLFYSYDSSVIDTATTLITKRVDPSAPDWRADTLKRLIVVGMLETYLPVDNRNFFEEIDRAIP